MYQGTMKSVRGSELMSVSKLVVGAAFNEFESRTIKSKILCFQIRLTNIQPISNALSRLKVITFNVYFR